jgi:hypothetical protein
MIAGSSDRTSTTKVLGRAPQRGSWQRGSPASSPPPAGSGGGKLQASASALAASLLVTALYHLGFAEFRGPALVQPLIGNSIVTAGYLASGSPLAAIASHVIMRVAAVVHGMESTVQLPPHY